VAIKVNIDKIISDYKKSGQKIDFPEGLKKIADLYGWFKNRPKEKINVFKSFCLFTCYR